MESITVNKAELLAKIQDNRDAHRATYAAASDAYRARAIELMEREIARARAGEDFNLFVNLEVPVDHTEEYDREIAMLEMEQDDVVRITGRLFDCVVMDNWGWRREWEATNSTYGVSNRRR